MLKSDPTIFYSQTATKIRSTLTLNRHRPFPENAQSIMTHPTLKLQRSHRMPDVELLDNTPASRTRLVVSFLLNTTII